MAFSATVGLSLITATSSQYRYDTPLTQDLGQTKFDQDQGPSIVGAPVTDLREVMRFDISPSWVIERFTRVSTVLADVRLKALRVPIVTGTRVDDLAGTLTYYFDGSGKVQRPNCQPNSANGVIWSIHWMNFDCRRIFIVVRAAAEGCQKI